MMRATDDPFLLIRSMHQLQEDKALVARSFTSQFASSVADTLDSCKARPAFEMGSPQKTLKPCWGDGPRPSREEIDVELMKRTCVTYTVFEVFELLTFLRHIAGRRSALRT